MNYVGQYSIQISHACQSDEMRWVRTVMTPELGVVAFWSAFQQKAGHMDCAVGGLPGTPISGRCCGAPLHKPPSFVLSG